MGGVAAASSAVAEADGGHPYLGGLLTAARLAGPVEARGRPRAHSKIWTAPSQVEADLQLGLAAIGAASNGHSHTQ